jgi:hypothetical protein
MLCRGWQLLIVCRAGKQLVSDPCSMTCASHDCFPWPPPQLNNADVQRAVMGALHDSPELEGLLSAGQLVRTQSLRALDSRASQLLGPVLLHWRCASGTSIRTLDLECRRNRPAPALHCRVYMRQKAACDDVSMPDAGAADAETCRSTSSRCTRASCCYRPWRPLPWSTTR